MTVGEQSAAPPGGRYMPVAQVIAIAEQRRQAGALASAEDLCRQILRAQPRNAEALHMLGIIAHQAGNVTAGIDLIKQAIAENPGSALFNCNLGEMCRLSGRLDEAIAAGRRSVELNPNYPAALNNLGIAYFDHQEFETAEGYYRRALALDPKFAEAFSNLGNALRAQKKLDDAVVAYKRAIELKPQYAEAYNNLATTLRDQKKAAEAEAVYRKALELKPDDAPTLNNLALAIMESDRFEEAAEILKRSAELDPRNGRTFVFLASTLLELEREEEAEAAVTKALSITPDDADAHNTAGRILLDRGQAEIAAGHFLEAIAKKPDMVDAYNNVGNAFKELGRLDDAFDAYLKARELAPKSTAVFINLVDAKSFESADDPDLLAMEALVGELDTMEDTDQMQLHFSLSKAYSDLKRHRESFDHLLKGCVLKRKTIDYPEADTLRIFDRIAEIFTPELMRQKAGLGDPSSVPLFVVGIPRSGSTLVEQILASHPKVFGAGELKDFDKIVKSVRGFDGKTLPYPEFVPSFQADHLRQMGEQYLRLLRAYSKDAPHITNKMPSSFFYVGMIHLALPNARVIHTMRNPVDTSMSCLSKLFSGAQDFTYDLGEMGRYYRKYTELMAHWRRVLPPGVMLDVQYEEVVEDLETQARRIIAFAGLEWNDACLAFYRNTRPIKTASAVQVRRPIYKSSIGRWLPYKDMLEPLLKELPLDQPV